VTRSAEPNPQLYDAVVAHPDDDAPRLAYADWFERHGQPERAQVIRLECQAARLPEDDPQRQQLDGQAVQLIWQHGKDWLAGRPQPAGVRWDFLRGFPEFVTFNSFKALEATQEEVFRYPVRRLGFTQLRSAARLANCPALARVQELELRGCKFGAEGVRLLVASPHVKGLTRLDLAWGNIGPAGARLLADWPQLRRLRVLKLRQCQLGDEGLLALAGSPYLAELTDIELARNDIGPVGLRALAEAGCWPGLRSLNLGANRLGAAGAGELVRAQQWTQLAVLNVQRNQLGDAGAAALAGALHLRGVRLLDVSDNGIGDAGATALAGSAALAGLRVLLLSGNLIGNAGAFALGRSPHLGAVRRLVLFGNAMLPALREALEEGYRDGEPSRIEEVVLPEPAPAESAPPPPLERGVGPADEDGILQAIIADPDDDTPRLVYADWLEENGQPDHAELIRLQCDPARQEPGQREKGLLVKNAARWLGPLVEPVESYSFDRGLLRVRVTLRTFLSRAFQEQAPGWLRQARVHGLELRGTTRSWDKVASSPVLAAVHELVLQHNGLGDAGLQALASSPHLAGLHTLRIAKGNLSAGLTALARSTGLPRLRRLELPENGINLESLHALAGWPQAARLTTLELTWSWLGAAAVAVLLHSPHLTGLVHLLLAWNSLRDAGAQALAGSAHLAGLRRLVLDHNHIGPEGVGSLVSSPHLQGLQTLRLYDNPIRDEGALLLGEWAARGELRSLTLCRRGLSEGAIARLKEMLATRLLLWW
jgi:uncharacterized protein (TIGR02996 family)